MEKFVRLCDDAHKRTYVIELVMSVLLHQSPDRPEEIAIGTSHNSMPTGLRFAGRIAMMGPHVATVS
jgi:hypothetical protein